MTKLLTVADVADVLSISKSLVYALVERGDLPFVPVGRSRGYRFDPADVQAFVQRRKQQKEAIQNEGRKSPTPRPRLKHIKL